MVLLHNGECPISSISFKEGLSGVKFTLLEHEKNMKKIRENAAGIDIGAKKVYVSVEGQEVKNFYLNGHQKNTLPVG